MLGANKITKYVSGNLLLNDVSFRLEPGEKATLVGVNGSGKSTLLKICAGLTSCDAGEISLPRDASVGYLPQHAELEGDRTVIEELRSVFSHVDEHFDELERLALQMGEIPHDSPEYEKVADRYGHLQHELDRLGAYDIQPRIEKIMAGLGFRPEDRDRRCAEFSGGWQMRILLGSLLLRNPDVLLLDEPTNHLDLETMIWLENWIRESDCSVLLVSHERRFMDALATRVFEVHDGKLTVYRGNYTAYLAEREERWAQWQREYDNQQLELAHHQRFIDRFRYNAAKAALVQSRIKIVEKIEIIPPPPKAPGRIKFRFPQPAAGSKEVFTLEGVKKSYGPNGEVPVLLGLDLTFWRGEKVALVGLNGAGKSTLLKILAGLEHPTAGAFKPGARTAIEYFAQYDAEGLTVGNTVWQEIASKIQAGMEEMARSLLGGFFFTGEDIDKPVTVLSGGERTRVRLAKMLFSTANTLLLDEPTNHLDIASRATLEDAMKGYEGTVIFVSHDRAFLDNVATRVIEIKDGRARSFPGNYSDYCDLLRNMGETSPLMGASVSAKPTKGTTVQTQTEAKEGKKGKKARPDIPQTAPKASASDGPARSDSREAQKFKKLAAQIEEQIGQVEARIASLDDRLADPEVYRDYTKSQPLAKEKEDLKAKLDALMAQWESCLDAANGSGKH